MIYNRYCIACDKEFLTDIDLLEYCDQCLSLDTIKDHLHSCFYKITKDNNEWSK